MAATAVVCLFRQRVVELPLVDQVINVIDAIGVPAYRSVFQ
ncbi:MAG: hypothetical protein ACK47M_16890 [Caldilinea sp.]